MSQQAQTANPAPAAADAEDSGAAAPPPAPAATQWTEHAAPDGRLYYYNAETQESTWERPAELGPLEMSPEAMLQAQMAMMHMGMPFLAPGMMYAYPPGSPGHHQQMMQQQQQMQMQQQQQQQQQQGQGQAGPAAGGDAGGALGASPTAAAAAAAAAVAYGYGSPMGMFPPFDFGAHGQYVPELVGPGPPIQVTASSQGPEGCNLFVFHIPNSMTNLELFDHFAVFGNVISARIMVEKESGRSRGFGFVSFDDPSAASDAIQAMDGFQVGHKRLKVQLKKEKGAPGSGGGGGGRGGGGRGNRRRPRADSQGSAGSPSPSAGSPSASASAGSPSAANE